MKLNIRKYHNLIVIFILAAFTGCGGNKSTNEDRIVIGISSDIENFNPMFAFSVNEGNVSELLYLSLVKHEWDKEKADINSYPMLAERWEWNNDSTSLTFYLRNDVKWSDGVKVSADDVAFSFDLYSDPLVQSRLYGTFTPFYTDTSNRILMDKSFEILSPEAIKINFRPGTHPSLFNVDLPVLPKHIFEKADRKNFNLAEEVFSRVTSGPFTLKDWKKNQFIVLAKNPDHFLNTENTVSEIVFKVVPDYTSRLMQLKKGEIDIVEEIKTDDVKDLKGESSLQIASVAGREYDYIGWNNIDPETYQKNGSINPNKLFGNANVRKALTYAVNRSEIVDEYLSGYGQICDVPFSPIMKSAFNKEVTGYEYNPQKAKELLKAEGWSDTDNDRIIDKKGQPFRFSLFIPGGNPRRAFTAQVVKNNLKDIGVDVIIETRELSHLIDNLFAKQLDTWIVSLYVPIPPDLRLCWHSDFQSANLNFASYRSAAADKIISYTEQTSSPEQKNNYYREFQQVIHSDQPVTFLYWIDNIVAYNKRIDQIEIDPLGVIQKCWRWSVRN